MVIHLDEMDLDIGSRFDSYEELIEFLKKYSAATSTKYWKRDARTISASRTCGNFKHVNPDLVYYELKFICIYGGLDSNPNNTKQHPGRKSIINLKTSGCPSYLRFKVTEDGEALQLVAMNVKHNHELVLPNENTNSLTRGKRRNSDDIDFKSKRIQDLTSLSNVEVEQEGDNSNELLQMLQDTKCEGIFEDSKEGYSTENYLFKGLIAPVLTPFNYDEKQTVNLDIIQMYAKFLKESGIEGVLVNGTVGEGMSLSVEERKLLSETWVDAVAETKQYLIVQVGGAPLPDVLELAKHSDTIGVNCLICLPDLFYKPKTVDDLIDYLKLVSDAAPHTPLIYQHIPQKTGAGINMGEFLNQVADRIPMLVGIEFSSSAMDEAYDALKADEGKFTVFLGTEKLIARAFTIGLNCGIFSILNVWPSFALNISLLCRDNKLENAFLLQNELNDIIDNISRFGDWVAVLKVLMKFLTPINMGGPRKPLKPLTESQEKELDIVLTNKVRVYEYQ